jgi:hypothetical protein
MCGSHEREMRDRDLSATGLATLERGIREIDRVLCRLDERVRSGHEAPHAAATSHRPIDRLEHAVLE